MSRVPAAVRSLLLPILGTLALLLGGCGDQERMSYATETDEPAYREGTELLKSGRKQEALNAFLKVIAKRGDDAAESHLEAGLLYLQPINDPLSAIYHFRQYLALRPNSPQAPLVKQRIDAATREFARTLPAQPLESQLQRVDLVATLDRLKQENEALKQELADVKANRGLGAAPVTPAAGPDGGVNFNLSVDSIPVVHTRPTAAPTPRAPVAAAARVVPAPAQAAPVKTGSRQHVVEPGDTLSKIALKYYRDRARWREIYAANRDVMSNESDLKVGVTLKIP